MRRRGVGVGFPAILGISAGIMPVMSCISHTYARTIQESRYYYDSQQFFSLLNYGHST